jgi:chromosome segregation ATPase
MAGVQRFLGLLLFALLVGLVVALTTGGMFFYNQGYGIGTLIQVMRMGQDVETLRQNTSQQLQTANQEIDTLRQQNSAMQTQVANLAQRERANSDTLTSLQNEIGGQGNTGEQASQNSTALAGVQAQVGQNEQTLSVIATVQAERTVQFEGMIRQTEIISRLLQILDVEGTNLEAGDTSTPTPTPTQSAPTPTAAGTPVELETTDALTDTQQQDQAEAEPTPTPTPTEEEAEPAEE